MSEQTKEAQGEGAGLSVIAAARLSIQQTQRAANAELVIQRYFVGKNTQDPASVAREAIMRDINPSSDFAEKFRKTEKEA